MKMKKTIGLVLVFCLVSAWVVAESTNEKGAEQSDKKPDISASRRDPRTSGHRENLPNRQQMFEKMIAQRFENQKKAVAELEEIKKIAEEEKATRTVEALQKMIDKKNAEFKQRMQQLEERRDQSQKRVQQQPPKKYSETKKNQTTENK